MKISINSQIIYQCDNLNKNFLCFEQAVEAAKKNHSQYIYIVFDVFEDQEVMDEIEIDFLKQAFK